MRSLYCLKRTVNKTKLSMRSLCTLFDSLIKPIVLYGAPLWCPSMSVTKTLCKIFSSSTSNSDHTSFLRKVSLVNCEKVHLNFLKWALGVNRRAPNLGTWGETGRYPLIYDCIKLTLTYIKRLQSHDDNSLVVLAFKEQQKLKLEWFRHIEPILDIDESYSVDHVTVFKRSKSQPAPPNNRPPREDFLIHNGFAKYIPKQTTRPRISKLFTPFKIIKNLKSHFKEAWESSKHTSPRMEFYDRNKIKFCKENYLDCISNYFDRANLTKLRISAHDLEIEMGRRKNIPRKDRFCKWCISSSGTKIIEDEDHILHNCSLYSSARQKTIQLASEVIGYLPPQADLMSLLNYSSIVQNTSQHNPSRVATREKQTIINVPCVPVIQAIAKFITTCLNTRTHKSQPPSVAAKKPRNTK